MIITLHGAGQEVGRSCIEINHNKRRILLDAGLKITPGDNEFPTRVKNIKEIQTTIISHTHLDHIGAIPLFYAQGLRSAIYMSPLTKEVMKILLKDSWKIAMIEQMNIGYRKRHIQDALDLVLTFEENNKKQSNFNIAGAKITTINAGHVPGSRSIYVQYPDKDVLYTGDISCITNELTKGLDPEEYPKNVDVLIIESTYGATIHPDRKEVIAELLDDIQKTLDDGGHVIIPTFSIGRAQELLSVIYQHKFSVPIYLDGMAKKVTEIYLSYPNEIENPEKLANAFHNVRLIETSEERELALEEQSIIITTAGMLDGGPICYYIPKIAKSKKTSIFLTGYQAEESNGRRLLSEGFVNIDGKIYRILCNVKKFDLSGHSGQDELQKIITTIKPKNVILQHGEGKQINALKEFVEQKTSAKCFTPKTGETINII